MSPRGGSGRRARRRDAAAGRDAGLPPPGAGSSLSLTSFSSLSLTASAARRQNLPIFLTAPAARRRHYIRPLAAAAFAAGFVLR